MLPPPPNSPVPPPGNPVPASAQRQPVGWKANLGVAIGGALGFVLYEYVSTHPSAAPFFPFLLGAFVLVPGYYVVRLYRDHARGVATPGFEQSKYGCQFALFIALFLILLFATLVAMFAVSSSSSGSDHF